MNKREQEIRQWLDYLEQYTKNAELPQRIKDRIAECRKDLCEGIGSEEKVVAEVEALLESIRKKALPETVKAGGDDIDAVKLKVKSRMKSIVQRCHDENEKSVVGMTARKEAAVKQCNMQLMEILRTEAHMEDIQNQDRYLQFYEQVANKYEKEGSEIISEMLEDMEQNYTHMSDHMKSVANELNNVQKGSVNGRIFYDLENKRAGIRDWVCKEYETGNAGREGLISFARRTGEHISKLVKKAEWKKKILTLLPICILAILVLLQMVPGFFNKAVKAENTESLSTVESVNETLDKIEKLSDILERLPQLGQFGLSALFMTIAVLLLVIVFYKKYANRMDTKCKQSVSAEVAKYLKNELIDFEKSGCLKEALENDIKNAAEAYEHENVLLFNEAFGLGTGNLEDAKGNAEKHPLDELTEMWNHIKNNM